MKDKFEFNNKLSLSGRYKIQVVDAKTDEVVKSVEADNAVCPWISDVLISKLGVQNLSTEHSNTRIATLYDFFRNFTLAKNDVGAGISNNKLIGHNIAYCGNVYDNLAQIDYQPIERIEGNNRTVGFTVEVGINYCNNCPFDTIILSSSLRYGFTSAGIYKVNYWNDSYGTSTYVPDHILTFDINPINESINVLSPMNDAILLKHINNKITTYEIRNILDGSIIWDSSEYNLPAYKEYNLGNYYVLMGRNSSSYLNKIIVINLISNEVKEYDYNSSIYDKLYSYSRCIFPTKGDKYIRFDSFSRAFDSDNTEDNLKIYQGDFITGEETLISDISRNKLYESFPESIKNTFLSFKDGFGIEIIHCGDDVGFSITPESLYNCKSGTYNQPVGDFIYDIYGNPIGQVPDVGNNYWYDDDGNNLVPIPRYGWRYSSYTIYSDISQTCKRYWIYLAELPDIECVSSMVSFPEISKTSQQILRITYELTQHNIGFPNKPSYLGFTPVTE